MFWLYIFVSCHNRNIQILTFLFPFIGIASDTEQELSCAPGGGIDQPDRVENDDVLPPASLLERLGAKTESKLEEFFRWWGTFCAERPWPVLFFGSY